jgi:hypothetical protein
MEPVYYVIAILGCADGSSQCTPVATVPTHYASQQACSAGTQQAVLARTDFDFPTLLAECRLSKAAATASQEEPRALPPGTLRS